MRARGRGVLAMAGVVLGLVAAIPAVPAARAFELAPGRVRDPAGLQLMMGATFNPVRDEYLLTYPGGDAFALVLSPAGVVGPETRLNDATGHVYWDVVAAHDPDRDVYLTAWRLDDPQPIYARFLDGGGRPLGAPFVVAAHPDGGVELDLVRCARSRRYLLVWTSWRTRTVRLQAIDGDPGAAQPLLGPQRIVEQGAFSGRAAYGADSDRTLVVFTKDFAPQAQQANVYGRFVSGDGASTGPRFDIDVGFENQQNPRVGYAAGADRWLVTYEQWNRPRTHQADVDAALIDPAGAVARRFKIAETGAPGWDVPGPIAFNASTGKLLASWFVNVSAQAVEVDPATGALGQPILISDQNASPVAAAARPHASDPQALFLCREGHGADGVHAGIVHLAGGGASPAPPASPPATSDGARFVTQTVNGVRDPAGGPVAVAPGARFDYAVTFENTGSATWTAAAGHHVATRMPDDHARFGASRIELDPADAIAPGASKTYAATLVAPGLAGTYVLRWQSRRGAAGWFGGASPGGVAIVVPELDASRFVGQTVAGARDPAQVELDPGERFRFEATFENAGSTAWTRADAYRLGTQDPQDNRVFGESRLPLAAADRIAPGGRRTFVAELTAPATPGRHILAWRLVREGVAWFGEATPAVEVRVRASAAVRFERAIYRVGESEGAVLLGLVREGSLAGEVSVDVATADRAATAGPDYVALAGPVVFADGESRRLVTIHVVDDREREGPEGLAVILGRPTAAGGSPGAVALGSPAEAVVVVTDDDGPGGGGCGVSPAGDTDPAVLLLVLLGALALGLRRTVASRTGQGRRDDGADRLPRPRAAMGASP